MDILEDPSPFFAHAARVRADFLGLTLSEADTRTHLIDPVVAMLGYTGLADVRREERVAATREAVDYVLLIDGQRHALIEAKGVQHDITAGHAAQCVHATVLGVRWCMITNGVIWALYDAHLDGSLKDKHVATGRLDQDDRDHGGRVARHLRARARPRRGGPCPPLHAHRERDRGATLGAGLPRHSGTSTRRQEALRRGRPAGRDWGCDPSGLASQSRDGGRRVLRQRPLAEPVPPAEPAPARQRSESDRITLSDLVDAGLLPQRRGTGTPAPGQSPRRATPRRAHRIRGAALDTRAGGLRRPGAPAQRLAVLAL